MAVIFWIRTDQELQKAYGLELKTGTETRMSMRGEVGWSVITKDATHAISTLIDANTDLSGADSVWFLNFSNTSSPGRTAPFSAGGGIDTYIIASSFTGQASTGTDTDITITDEGENIFRFRDDVKISSATLTQTGHLELSFGGNTHIALTIENAKDASFRLGNDNMTAVSLGQFLALTQNAGTATDAQYKVVNSGVTLPDPVALVVTCVEVVSGGDSATRLDHTNSNNNDLAASGTLTITDGDGIASVMRTSTLMYGTFSITQDTNNSDNWDWTYTLDDTDEDTRGLAAGGDHMETITLTITDNHGDSNTDTYEFDIDITVIGTAVVDTPIVTAAPNSDMAVALNHTTPTNTDTGASGTLTITDTDGVASVAASVPRYGVFSITRDGATDNWDWVYTLNPHTSATRALAVGDRTDTITLTITDDEGNRETHALPITITVAGTAPADGTIVDAAKTLTIHGVRFTAIDPDAQGTQGIAVFRAGDTAIGLVDGGGKYFLRMKPAKTGVTPDVLENLWNNQPGHEGRTAAITAEVIDNTLQGITGNDLANEVGFNGITFKNPTYKVMLDHATPANNVLEASGVFIITDTDGVASVSASAPTYGRFGITRNPGTDNWIWAYNLNPRDSNTHALSAGAHDEIITLTITDDGGNTATHRIGINIQVTGTATADVTLIDAASDSDYAVVLDHNDSTNDDLAAGGTLTITDSDGVAPVVATAATYGTFSISQTAGTNNWVWTYNLDSRGDNTLGLAQGIHEETITLTITDMATGTPNMTPHEIKINVAIIGVAPIDREATIAGLPTIIIHGVKFSYISNDPLPDGLGLRPFASNNEPDVFLMGDYYRLTVALNDTRLTPDDVNNQRVTPESLADLWNNAGVDPGARKARIRADIINADLAAIDPKDFKALGDDGAILFPDAPSYDARLDHTTLTNSITDLFGTLRISDEDVVASVAKSDTIYGNFTISQAGTTDYWNWAYRTASLSSIRTERP